MEAEPPGVDGILYGTGQNDRAFALDARTGRPLWRYRRNLPGKLQPCCGMVNRGFAILGDKLFMATLDAHVIALDTKTGNLLWDNSRPSEFSSTSYRSLPRDRQRCDCCRDRLRFPSCWLTLGERWV